MIRLSLLFPKPISTCPPDVHSFQVNYVLFIFLTIRVGIKAIGKCRNDERDCFVAFWSRQKSIILVITLLRFFFFFFKFSSSREEVIMIWPGFDRTPSMHSMPWWTNHNIVVPSIYGYINRLTSFPFCSALSVEHCLHIPFGSDILPLFRLFSNGP